jgi:hypothetical protein
LLIGKNPHLITTTLSNIFTMRLVGNKTHGDLAEIAIAEFINQFMYDFKSVHVGKDLYRAKKHEEDIKVINEITGVDFPVSLKAFGHGFLQLSTDKNSEVYSALQAMRSPIEKKEDIALLWKHGAFAEFSERNVLPLIYNKQTKKCNILVFNAPKAKKSVRRVALEGKGDHDLRKHKVYRFYDEAGGYVCEVRYGGKTANPFQRGLWTHTRNACKYFDTLTDGWIDYSDNFVLVKLFSHALLATVKGHEAALAKLKEDIEEQKLGSQLRP